MFFRKRPESPLVSLGSLGFHKHFMYDDRLYVNMGASVDGDHYPVMKTDTFEVSTLPKSTLVLRVSVTTKVREYSEPSLHY